VAVIDGNWATVGSSNIDPFSLMLAKEANIVVRNRAFAMHLRQSLNDAISDEATELRPRDWRKLSWHSRLLRWTCYQLVRLAIGIAGYGGKH
jgi:cardiolipin synthase